MKKMIYFFVILFCFNPSAVFAQESLELEELVDSFFQEKLNDAEIPGAVIVLIKDGEAVLTKGYGYADINHKIPMSSKTLMNNGSISKIFTATSMMQLYEEGRLKLDQDIKSYLKHPGIVNDLPDNITVHQLLTHTSGLAHRGLGTAVSNQNSLPSLSEYLSSDVIHQIADSGEAMIYSSIGIALLGHLIEEVTNETYDQYVTQHIFLPLEMNHSSTRQTLPPDVKKKIMKRYHLNGNSFLEYSKDYLSTIPPAGGFYVTAEDMEKFLLFHINKGKMANGQLLKAETMNKMHEQQEAQHESLRGRTYGFAEMFMNGERFIFQDGGIPGTDLRLFLAPEHKFGFFLAYNTNNYEVKKEFTSEVVDFLFPPTEKNLMGNLIEKHVQSNGSRWDGQYSMLSYSSNSIEKFLSLFQQIPVRSNGKELIFGSIRYDALKHGVFKRSDQQEYLITDQSRDGNSMIYRGTASYKKLHWYETNGFHFSILAFCLLVFIGTLITVLIRKYKLKNQEFKTFGLVISLFNLIFIAGFFLVFYRTNEWEFIYGLPLSIKLITLLPLINTGYILGYFFIHYKQIKQHKFPFAFLMFTHFLFMGWLMYWRIIGWYF
ncbi:MAG: serine hydrolase [Bacillaceae bacterium]|nr:serine hydrolase [Bacillaceae bacterium]